jgi:hypothetical protein
VEERIWIMHGHKVAGIQMYINSPSRKEWVVCDIFVSLRDGYTGYLASVFRAHV